MVDVQAVAERFGKVWDDNPGDRCWGGESITALGVQLVCSMSPEDGLKFLDALADAGYLDARDAVREGLERP
jgi:hypothetical protein